MKKNTVQIDKDLSNYYKVIVKRHTKGWNSLKVFNQKGDLLLGNILDTPTITFLPAPYNHSKESKGMIKFNTLEGRSFCLKEGERHCETFLTLYSLHLDNLLLIPTVSVMKNLEQLIDLIFQVLSEVENALDKERLTKNIREREDKEFLSSYIEGLNL